MSVTLRNFILYREVHLAINFFHSNLNLFFTTAKKVQPLRFENMRAVKTRMPII